VTGRTSRTFPIRHRDLTRRNMGIINTKLLLPLQKIIGSAPAPTVTVLDDDSMSMVMPIVPHIARRGLSAGSGGWGIGVLRTVHTAADSEQTDFLPYTAGAAAIAPFPPVIELDEDLWLLGVSGVRFSGTGDLTGGVLELFGGANNQQFFGIDDAGATIVQNRAIPLAIFDGQHTITPLTDDEPLLLVQGGCFLPLNLRLPRSCQLRWTTEASDTAIFDLKLLMGRFHAGLGQDVVT